LKKILESREGKVNVNSFDNEGQTALHQSCMNGNLKLVKLLVNSTVSPFRTASKNPFWYLFPAFIANTFIPFDQMKNKTLSLKFPACQIATTPLVGSRPVLCIALI
jgi:hypothetical protein